ncbi:MAG: hypothetical protein WA817_16535 [Candidatus Acidiferrum sp.]
MGRIPKYWWSAVSAIASAIALWAGLTGRGPGPSVLWILAGFAGLTLAAVLAIWAETRRARVGSAFMAGLVARCDRLILDWKLLEEAYGQRPDPTTGKSTLIPNPMDVAWPTYGFKDWHFQIGNLQGRTYALLGELEAAGVQLEPFDHQRLSMAALLHMLEKYMGLVKDRQAALR